MSNTVIAYQFDNQGYYLSETLVQKLGNDFLIPSDTTMTKPILKNGYWSKWNGSKWINEKIPTTCQEIIDKGLTCISNGQGKHNYEIKSLMKSLVDADKEHYKTIVSDDFVMSIEKIPEPTEEEKTSKLADEMRARRDAELNATDFYLMPDYPISSELLVQIKEYRQQLRDLPQQEGFPYVDFPVSPISK